MWSWYNCRSKFILAETIKEAVFYQQRPPLRITNYTFIEFTTSKYYVEKTPFGKLILILINL